MNTRLSTVLFILSVLCVLPLHGEIRVLVSIKPIHALVSAVMGDTGKPELLLTGAQSPHGFQLKPSQVRALYGADLIFYIDDDFETFLSKPLRSDSMSGESFALSGSKGVEVKSWHHEGEEGEHGHHGHEGHECSARDLHLWLCFDNTLAMVDAIAVKLSEVQPAQSEVFLKNAEGLKEEIKLLEEELKSVLSGLGGRSYMVFHDAYGYFEKRYGLSNAGVISPQPGVPLSAKQMSRIREVIDSEGVVCIFSEPQFSDAMVSRIAEEAELRYGVLDPLGADLEPGPDLYLKLMRQLAGHFQEGLR